MIGEPLGLWITPWKTLPCQPFSGVSREYALNPAVKFTNLFIYSFQSFRKYYSDETEESSANMTFR